MRKGLRVRLGLCTRVADRQQGVRSRCGLPHFSTRGRSATSRFRSFRVTTNKRTSALIDGNCVIASGLAIIGIELAGSANSILEEAVVLLLLILRPQFSA